MESSYNLGEYNLANIPPIQPIVNISLGNLFSDEAMKGFSSMLQSFLESFLILMSKGNLKINKKSFLLNKDKKKEKVPKNKYIKKKKKDLTSKKEVKKKEKLTKENRRREKKDETYFLKPQPKMPINRKENGYYTLRGQTNNINYESSKNAIIFDNNKQSVNTENNNIFESKKNNIEINDYDYLSSNISWY